MIYVGLLFVAVVGMWLIRRRARARVLAGRVAEKPTYQVEPPRRRMGSPLKDGRL